MQYPQFSPSDGDSSERDLQFPSNNPYNSLKYPKMTEVWYPEDYNTIARVILEGGSIVFNDKDFCSQSTSLSISNSVDRFIECYRDFVEADQISEQVAVRMFDAASLILSRQYAEVSDSSAIPAVLKLADFVAEMAHQGRVPLDIDEFSIGRSQFLVRILERDLREMAALDPRVFKRIFRAMRTDPSHIVSEELLTIVCKSLYQFRNQEDPSIGNACLDWLKENIAKLAQGRAVLHSVAGDSPEGSSTRRQTIWKHFCSGLTAGVAFFRHKEMYVAALKCSDDLLLACEPTYFSSEHEYLEVRSMRMLQRSELKARMGDFEGMHLDAKGALLLINHLPSEDKRVLEARALLSSL